MNEDKVFPHKIKTFAPKSKKQIIEIEKIFNLQELTGLPLLFLYARKIFNNVM